jgi:hypothetical protein
MLAGMDDGLFDPPRMIVADHARDCRRLDELRPRTNNG